MARGRKPAYHSLYKLAIWCDKPNGLRWQCLVKALFTCKSCGWQARANETHLLVCDHIKPHKGDYKLFIDTDNHQCLCAPCHDRDKQQQERIGYSTAVGLDGWPISPDHPANSR